MKLSDGYIRLAGTARRVAWVTPPKAMRRGRITCFHFAPLTHLINVPKVVIMKPDTYSELHKHQRTSVVRRIQTALYTLS